MKRMELQHKSKKQRTEIVLQLQWVTIKDSQIWTFEDNQLLTNQIMVLQIKMLTNLIYLNLKINTTLKLERVNPII